MMQPTFSYISFNHTQKSLAFEGHLWFEFMESGSLLQGMPVQRNGKAEMEVRLCQFLF